MKISFNDFAQKARMGLSKLFKKSVAGTKRGYQVLRDGALNKSTAFTHEERDALGLRGLLPHAVDSLEEQRSRVWEHLQRKPNDIDRYIYLAGLQDRSERLFYSTAINRIDDIMPLIYTPTVGQACKEFAHNFRNPRGLYITPDDKGKIRGMLDNWPADDVRVTVMTDGQRILGLGDLGANGMGIPIGKLALYTVCGGLDPALCLPIMFDVGTNNEELRNDPLYLGYPHPRIEGRQYDELMEELVAALKDKYPKIMIQFEDFLTPNAYKLLNKYRERTTCFNDDIQGTAAVALAGLYTTTRVTGIPLKDQRIMFLGAGSAATGIADLLVKAMQEEGLTPDEARAHITLVDVNGLITAKRTGLDASKSPFAHDNPEMGFVDAIKYVKPTILIGATGAAGTFTQEVIETMSAQNERPVIFALSNPTDHAECTAEQAYYWSKGRALFASGSPFAAVEYEGQTFNPSQANNAYIFPGLGLGVVLSESSIVTDDMFLASAKTVAAMVTAEDLAAGSLFPPLKDIRRVSARIAEAVVNTAHEQQIAGAPHKDRLREYIEGIMYNPDTSVSGINALNNNGLSAIAP